MLCFSTGAISVADALMVIPSATSSALIVYVPSMPSRSVTTSSPFSAVVTKATSSSVKSSVTALALNFKSLPADATNVLSALVTVWSPYSILALSRSTATLTTSELPPKMPERPSPSANADMLVSDKTIATETNTAMIFAYVDFFTSVNRSSMLITNTLSQSYIPRISVALLCGCSFVNTS